MGAVWPVAFIDSQGAGELGVAPQIRQPDPNPGMGHGHLESPRAATPDEGLRTPLVGLPRRDRFYAIRLRQLAHIDVDETRAAALWRSVARHRRELTNQLGRDVGQRVALLDYIVNVEPQLAEPQIIDRPALEAMETRAVMDGVSGLHNRAHFETALAWETERSMRYGRPASLLLLDLDGFKAVNDSHGHRVGDQVLQAVGALILRHVRAADIPCRYGGDEFAVILPDTPPQVAAGVAERICEDINVWFARNDVAGSRVTMAASCGVASLPLPERAIGGLFEVADRALYEAKRSGGGRVIMLKGEESAL